MSSVLPPTLSPEGAQDFVDRLAGASTWHTPAEVSEERDLRNRAHNALAELATNTTEWNGWLRDFVEGRTEQQHADAVGVTHQAISKRRLKGLERIRPVLKKHGLRQEDS